MILQNDNYIIPLHKLLCIQKLCSAVLDVNMVIGRYSTNTIASMQST